MHAQIFSVLRALKSVNPGDMYLEAYLGHFARQGDDFLDIYMLQFLIGRFAPRKRILEVGTRTGISLCQLLAGHLSTQDIERVICVDPMNDGFLSPHIVQRNLKQLGLPWDLPSFIREGSQTALPTLIDGSQTFDYILIDGDHTKEVAAQDLRHAIKILEPGGILLFDDISDAPGECGLIDVWREFVEPYEGDDLVGEFKDHGKGVAWLIKS